MPLFGLKRKRSDDEPRGRSRPRGRSLERKRSFILRKRASTISQPSLARSRAECDSHPSRPSTARRRPESDFQSSQVAKLKRRGSLLLVKLHLRKRRALHSSKQQGLTNSSCSTATSRAISGRYLLTTPSIRAPSKPSIVQTQHRASARVVQLLVQPRPSTGTATKAFRPFRESKRHSNGRMSGRARPSALNSTTQRKKQKQSVSKAIGPR